MDKLSKMGYNAFVFEYRGTTGQKDEKRDNP